MNALLSKHSELLFPVFVYCFVWTLLPSLSRTTDPHAFGGQHAMQDQEHVKEHLKGRLNVEEGMSADSVKFHYFRMYDISRDARLDGTEIIKAVTHTHTEAGHPGTQPQFSDEDLERIVDRTLAAQDLNNDGYIDFAEFINSRS